MKPRGSVKPIVGELIYGCYHPGSACGSVEKVGDRVTTDGMDHWWATEHFNGRTVRVRRETDGALYEVELRPS